MDFIVDYYESVTGNCPVKEFLHDLKNRDPDEHAGLMARLNRLSRRECHRPPLSKPIGDGLFELRQLGKLNARVLYFFMHGRRIIAVHGIRNKARAIPARDRWVALERMKDWKARHPE